MRITALCIVVLMSLTGCNTIKGLGTDLHDIAQNTQTFFEDTTGYTTDTRTPSPSSASRSINNRSAYAD